MRSVAITVFAVALAAAAPVTLLWDDHGTNAVVNEEDASNVVPEIPETELWGELMHPERWLQDLGLADPPPPPPCQPGGCCDAIDDKINAKVEEGLKDIPDIAKGAARAAIHDQVAKEMKSKGIMMCDDYKKEKKCNQVAAIAGCAKSCGVCDAAAKLLGSGSGSGKAAIAALKGDLHSIKKGIAKSADAVASGKALAAAKAALHKEPFKAKGSGAAPKPAAPAPAPKPAAGSPKLFEWNESPFTSK